MRRNRQHHVWKAYLRAWATKEKIAVLQNGRARTADIADVAVQRHFYKLHALTDEEIAYIRLIWMRPLREGARRNAELNLFEFTKWARMRDAMTEEQVKSNPELVRLLDERVVNAEEEYHSGWENRAAPLILSARNGNLDFLSETNHAIVFTHFIALQHFRTRAMRERVIKRFEGNSPFDIARLWNVVSHIMASQLGASIYKERKRAPFVLVRNSTSVPFITSDQPLANLLGGSADDKPPEHMALYYPISPELGILLDDPDWPCGIKQGELTMEEVERLNSSMVRGSYQQIFASTKQQLEDLAGAMAS